jgi:nitrite reductase/ring-hydroxylating ferredoxin subunit/DMSO/TMAO reductase YedYZ heme-binding membrane subunit
MSVGYQAVGWNRQKRIYDATLAVGVGVYLALFCGLGAWRHPESTIETMVIRACGTAAFLLLHLVLAIGPLCRIDRRFLPLLYNRRHLGVTMFVLALVHGAFSLFQFHALGVLDPLVSLLTGDGSFASAATLPFQIFGAAALVILFLMAATSHDFWLANLSAPTWKALHMLVYVAYVLLVVHVLFGAVQTHGGGWIGVATLTGAAGLIALHAIAAGRERSLDRIDSEDGAVEIDVCSVDEIPEKRAKIVSIAGERVAVFRYDGKISAVSNVCQHQNGPLGEGRIIDGCITCPWHGYQYLPDTGASPPPFKEKIPTFAVSVRDGRVYIDPRPRPAGTRVAPARIEPARFV